MWVSHLLISDYLYWSSLIQNRQYFVLTDITIYFDSRWSILYNMYTCSIYTIKGMCICNYIITDYTYINDSGFYCTLFDHWASTNASVYGQQNAFCYHFLQNIVSDPKIISQWNVCFKVNFPNVTSLDILSSDFIWGWQCKSCLQNPGYTSFLFGKKGALWKTLSFHFITC